MLAGGAPGYRLPHALIPGVVFVSFGRGEMTEYALLIASNGVKKSTVIAKIFQTHCFDAIAANLEFLQAFFSVSY